MKRVTHCSCEFTSPYQSEGERGVRTKFEYNLLFLKALPAGILVTTGIAKVVAAFGHGQILALNDPVFQIPFRGLLLLSGCIEVAVAAIAFLSKEIRASMVLIAWLSTCFLVYRAGLALLGWHSPCSCFGALTDSLHIAPHLADRMAIVLLAYLLIVSYGALLAHWRSDRSFRHFALAVVVLLLSSSAFSNQALGYQYEVNGQISGVRHLARGSVRNIEPVSFQVFVHDCRWFIQITSSKPNSPGMILQMSFDGHYQYKLGKLRANSSASDKSPSWGGSIGPDDVPYFGPDPLIPVVWLALADTCRLDNNSHSMPPPYSVDLLRPELTILVTRRRTPPRLPEVLVFIDDGYDYHAAKPEQRKPPFNTGFTNAIFSASNFTNVDGIEIPLEFELRVVRPAPATNSTEIMLEPDWQFHGEVLNVASHSSLNSFVPEIPDSGAGSISDKRFAEATAKVRMEFRYGATNWLPVAEVTNLPGFTEYMRSQASKTNFVPALVTVGEPSSQTLRRTLIFVLLGAISLPTALFFLKQYRKHKQ